MIKNAKINVQLENLDTKINVNIVMIIVQFVRATQQIIVLIAKRVDPIKLILKHLLHVLKNVALVILQLIISASNAIL